MDLYENPYDGQIIPRTTRGWIAVRLPGGEAHVLPVADGMYHLPDECGCRPRVDLVERTDDSFGIVHVHNSLDNREANEPS